MATTIQSARYSPALLENLWGENSLHLPMQVRQALSEGYQQWFERANVHEKQVFGEIFDRCKSSPALVTSTANEAAMKSKIWRRYIRVCHRLANLNADIQSPVSFLKAIYSNFAKLFIGQKTTVDCDKHSYRSYCFKAQGKNYLAIFVRQIRSQEERGSSITVVLEPLALKLQMMYIVPKDSPEVPLFGQIVNTRWHQTLAKSQLTPLLYHERGGKEHAAVSIFKYYEGGDLLDFINAYGASLTAHTRCLLAVDILEQVAFLHAKGIAHRDIKLENVIIKYNAANVFKLTLIDFEFASYCDADKRRAFMQDASDAIKTKYENTLGTLGFMAPEVIMSYKNKQAGTAHLLATDMWSLGCLLMYLLEPSLPTELATWVTGGIGTLDQELFEETYNYYNDKDFYELLGELSKTPPAQLVWHCLNPDPTQRITSQAALELAKQALAS